MTTEQISTLVNEANAEAFGTNAITVIDTSSLIALGNTVLSSSTNTEAFLNVMVQRIGRTILRFRDYRNKLSDMVLDDFEYGAILQKLYVYMPKAEDDDSYDLIDGQSIDHYKISKPQVDQKLFVTRTPYKFRVTIQDERLKEAFLSFEAMGGFIAMVFGQVRNAIECSLENLSRVTLATAIAECAGTGRMIDLVTLYTSLYGGSLDAVTCQNDPDFMRFAMSTINSYIDGIQDMSTLYNNGSLETFTPREDIRLKMISSFNRRLETVVQYAAFHDRFVRPDVDFVTLNYWQSAQDPMDIKITRPSDSDSVSRGNIIALLHDRDAMGVYKKDERVATTPLNADGLYYNTVYHMKELRFIDLSENFIAFTLN